ncbi:DUF3053 family protein [Pseudocitrobacter cyperus]|uniref:DUF3053 family protein n=1 Tax=Pseudocitrobacter cyperus TaxID=3112843 RepID=A0ABV0HFZ5_9ENTR
MTRLVAVIVLVILVGCADINDGQRQAFITFLNTEVIAPPVVKVCELTPGQRISFGRYAEDYDVLNTAFQEISDVIYQTGNEDKVTGRIQSERDNLSLLNELRSAQSINNQFILRLKNVSAQNQRRYNALRLPADLKPVFDAAWEKTVVPFDETITHVYFLRGKRLDLLVAMGAFLQGQGDKVHFNTDGSASFSEPEANHYYRGLQSNLFTVQDDINILTEQMIAVIRSQQTGAEPAGL